MGMGSTLVLQGPGLHPPVLGPISENLMCLIWEKPSGAMASRRTLVIAYWPVARMAKLWAPLPKPVNV